LNEEGAEIHDSQVYKKQKAQRLGRCAR
jgi:hypothetical protein